MRRVVITGVGVVSPLGNDKDIFWQNVKQGKCGVDYIKSFETDDQKVKVAAEVKDFKPKEFMEKKAAKRMDKFSQYAVAASNMAYEDSKLDNVEVDKERLGVIFGNGIGGIETIESQQMTIVDKGPARVSPFFIPMAISNMAVGHVAIMLGAKNICYSLITACAASTNAIGESFRRIKYNHADIMITGGSEACVTPLIVAGFASMKALSFSDDPKRASIPFDNERDGFVIGEGAGVLVVEDLEHAKKRNAHIYAEIVGYGATCDAYHITAPAPEGEGAAKAMRLALSEAQISPDQISYINAHGTGTIYNDKFETKAIKSVFKDNEDKICVSSTKSMTGHLLGAAGGIEAIICARALEDGYIPPTIGLQNKDPDCDLDYVPNKGRHEDMKYVMSNSLGFGGHNATLILKKWEE